MIKNIKEKLSGIASMSFKFKNLLESKKKKIDEQKNGKWEYFYGKNYGALKVLCPSEVADSGPVICCCLCNVDVTVDVNRGKLVVQNTVTSVRINLSWIV